MSRYADMLAVSRYPDSTDMSQYRDILVMSPIGSTMDPRGDGGSMLVDTRNGVYPR